MFGQVQREWNVPDFEDWKRVYFLKVIFGRFSGVKGLSVTLIFEDFDFTWYIDFNYLKFWQLVKSSSETKSAASDFGELLML